jgi:F-box/leucine-rich repeat protein 4
MGTVFVEVDFAAAVRPDAVQVYESFNPGAIARVEARAPDGTWVVLWEGVARQAPAPAVFDPPLASWPHPVRTLRLVLDTDRVAGWNEVDAVALVGDGRRQWASGARASSTYGVR